jgi:hypothetical protein
MVIHTKERFQFIVNTLNDLHRGAMTFQLAGSLADKPASFHDADIIVYPTLPVSLEEFTKACVDGGSQVVAIDKDSRTPFPGRPDGQWRIQIKFPGGEVVDLFFPKPKEAK